jgi:hypothetical protein
MDKDLYVIEWNDIPVLQRESGRQLNENYRN